MAERDFFFSQIWVNMLIFWYQNISLSVWRKGILLHYLVGKWVGAATKENSVEVPQKLKIELPYDPTIPLLGTYSDKTIIWKDMCPYVHCSIMVTQTVKNLPAMQETWVWSLGQEDALKKEMASHSSILAWRIPWAEDPGGLKSMGLQRVRHDWATNTFS